MIGKPPALALITRLSGLDKYPKEKGREELTLALMAAETMEIAQVVVSSFVDYARECPKPSDLRRLVWEENEKLHNVAPRKRECQHCYGAGHRFCWDPASPDYLKRTFCFCQAGKQLRADKPGMMEELNELASRQEPANDNHGTRRSFAGRKI